MRSLTDGRDTPSHLRQPPQQIHAAVGVAPFVVVPAADLDQAFVDDHGQLGVEYARRGVVHDVDGDDGVLAVFEDAVEETFRSGITSPMALAAPVLVGIMDTAADRARRGSLWAKSIMLWSLV